MIVGLYLNNRTGSVDVSDSEDVSGVCPLLITSHLSVHNDVDASVADSQSSLLMFAFFFVVVSTVRSASDVHGSVDDGPNSCLLSFSYSDLIVFREPQRDRLCSGGWCLLFFGTDPQNSSRPASALAASGLLSNGC